MQSSFHFVYGPEAPLTTFVPLPKTPQLSFTNLLVGQASGAAFSLLGAHSCQLDAASPALWRALGSTSRNLRANRSLFGLLRLRDEARRQVLRVGLC
jgi:hypothetical protein